MVKMSPWQRLSSAPAAPQGAPGGSGRLDTPRARGVRPLGAQPLPRVLLELARASRLQSRRLFYL